MKSLQVTFNSNGRWTIDSTKVAQGTQADVQAVLVNVASTKGSDLAVPNAGTRLLARGVAGLMSNRLAAVHEANFAAAETLEVINAYTPSAEWLQGVWLEVESFAPPRLTLRAVIQDARGVSVGYPLTV